MNKYTQWVKILKLRKYYKGKKRFSSKKFITKTLPLRFKKISKLQPLLFKKFNEVSKTSRIAVEKMIIEEIERLKINIKFNKDYKYKPKIFIKFFFKSSNLRNFDKHLNIFLRTSTQTKKIVKKIFNEFNIKNLSEAKQNEKIIKILSRFDDKRKENKLLGIYSDSDKLLDLLTDEMDIEINKNNVDFNEFFDEY